jgi:hypothetical protein
MFAFKPYLVTQHRILGETDTDHHVLSDYNPRLAFRDDTSRIVERMHEVSKTGSVVLGSYERKTFNLAN